MRKPNKGPNSKVMGTWPLFYYHTSFSSGSQCGISFNQHFKYKTKCEVTELQNYGITEL